MVYALAVRFDVLRTRGIRSESRVVDYTTSPASFVGWTAIPERDQRLAVPDEIVRQCLVTLGAGFFTLAQLVGSSAVQRKQNPRVGKSIQIVKLLLSGWRHLLAIDIKRHRHDCCEQDSVLACDLRDELVSAFSYSA